MGTARPEPVKSAAAADRTARGWRERLSLTAEVLLAYAQTSWRLHRLPISEVVAAQRDVGGSQGKPDAEQLAEARRLGWIVVRGLRLLPGDTRCLTRSLVLLKLLAARGIPTRLVIGARSGPDFLAHAWVECEGEPVIDPGDSSFGRLVEL